MDQHEPVQSTNAQMDQHGLTTNAQTDLFDIVESIDMEIFESEDICYSDYGCDNCPYYGDCDNRPQTTYWRGDKAQPITNYDLLKLERKIKLNKINKI